MATRTISRSIFCRPAKSLSFLFTRSFSSTATLSKTPASSFYTSLLSRSRPVAAFASVIRGGLVSVKGLSTQATSSSRNDPNPNWSNRPPKETIALEGCDFEHWLVVVDPPEGEPTRNEIIDSYIKTLAQVVGSEDEARMKIYSVSTRCYYAFGALVSEDLSHKLKEVPNVRWVMPDSYLDVRNKDYGGEPFIDGKAVPYDPKYHEDWIMNQAMANERNRGYDSEESTFTELNQTNWSFEDTPQILVPIAEDSEEIEAITLVDILRRAKANVVIAAVGNSLEVIGSCQAKLVAEVLLDEVAEKSFDLIVLPGGLKSATRFASCETLVNMLKKQAEADKPYGGSCASPALVFEPNGLLKGKKATTHPMMSSKLSDQSHVEHRVVVDGNVITSRAPGTAMEFSLAIVEKFYGREKAVQLATSVLFIYQ